MYTEEEINAIGIIPEADLKDITNAKELETIIFEALGMGPMFDPLMIDLRAKGMLEHESINQADIFKVLYSDSFLRNCPCVSYIFNPNLY